MRYSSVMPVLLACAALSALDAGGESLTYQFDYAKGVAAVNRLDYAAAVGHFKDALEARPGDRDSRFYLGFSYNRMGEQEKAVAVLDELVRENPGDIDAAAELGIALYYEKEYHSAERILSEVIAARPENAEARYHLGLVWLEMGDFDRARQLLNEAAERDKSYAVRAHHRLGLAHLDRNRTSEALSEFLLAYQADPSSEEAVEAAALARALKRKVAERRFRLEVEARYEYDDNVVLAPDEGDVIDITDKGDFRFATATTAMFTLPVHDVATLFSSYRFVQSVHHHIGEFNLLGHDLSAGLDFNLPGVSPFIGYEYEYYFLDDCHQDYLRSNTLITGATFSEAWFAFSRPFYRFRTDDFFLPYFTGDDNRDARNHAVGLDQYFVLARDSSRWLRLGIDYERNNADGINYTYNGLDLYAELLTPLVGGLTLDLFVEYMMRNYFESSYHRYDDQQNYIITLSRQLNEYCEVGLQYQLIVNDSTVALFQYQRGIYSLVSVMRF